ncbi:D-alanyl-D-alanine carboxypeptidase family protein [Streptomyces sp. NPDC058045]|uniref:D-alanyl-D-alanine carboxypeptidase family protein n=1 Tax=Streptomyces sp. NPDC058045 TaxID=3346311 RepID=UPI0036E4CEBB
MAGVLLFGVVPAAPALVPGRPEPDPDPPQTASELGDSGTQVRLRAGAPSLPSKVSGLSWVVADAGSGDVLAAHAAHRKLPPASTLKTLFAVTAMPHIPDGGVHTVTESELAGVAPGSSRVGIVAGNTYRVPDLWRGVFLSSGNDAVHVLAGMNGGWESTAEQMQAKADALGARDTTVVSPDGYDEPGQVSSAFDLAVFARAGLRIPEFAEYCSTGTADFPGNGGRTFEIQNTNRLLSGADGVRRYPGLVGVKNGYTSHAGNTLIAAARKDGRTVLVSVMNPQSGESNAVYEEARRLLDWGGEAAGQVVPVGSLESSRSAAPAAAGPDRGVQSSQAAGAGESGGFPSGRLLAAACLAAAAAVVWLRARFRRRRES